MPKKYEMHGQNEPLKTPRRTRARTIFQSVDILLTHGEHFTPAWDSTDHMTFKCDACKTVADVLAVQFVPHYDIAGSVLYFRLGCPKCGKTGQRKIYLESMSTTDPAVTHVKSIKRP